VILAEDEAAVAGAAPAGRASAVPAAVMVAAARTTISFRICSPFETP
jgi:hypothetical protein